MLTISVWPRRLKEFLLTHPLYKSPEPPWPLKTIGNLPLGRLPIWLSVASG